MPDRPHVVVICRAAGGPGGVAQVAVRHCVELAREFRVTLISDWLPLGMQGIEVKPRSYNLLRRFAHVPNELAFARAVREALFKLDDVDFVISHGDVPAVVAALPYRKARGVPFGFVTHGDMHDRPRGAFDVRLSALFRWAEKRSAPNADLVIALGPAMAALARKRGAREKAIAIVPNGVDVADLGPLTKTQSIDLLFVGRLAIEKGVADLAEAMRIAGDRAHLTVAGSGAVPIAGSNITLLGPVPKKSLGAIYASANAVVAPSISEAMPMVLLESLACGTPVITCPVGDVPSIVEDGVNGLLVPPHDPRALANAILRLPDVLDELKARAKSSVLPKFAWETTGVLLRDAVRARLRHNR